MQSFTRAAALLLLAAHPVRSSQINQITATRGSLAGGTYVTVFGDGFDRDGRDGSTRVWFGNDECNVVWYDSTATKLVCYAPPHDVQEFVQVKISHTDIQANAMFSECPSKQCTFQYRWDRTPRVDVMHTGGPADASFRAYGQFVSRARTLVVYHPRASDRCCKLPTSVQFGDSWDMYTIRIGDALCSIDESMYRYPSDMMDNGGAGYVRCTVGEQAPGRYNVSIKVHSVTEGYGEAWKARRSKKVTFDGTVYQFTAHPRIASLSSHAGGLGGRSEMVIAGSGFAPQPELNVVELAGVPCEVTAATFNELRCRIGASSASTPGFNASSKALYPAGRGLVNKIYYNKQQTNGADITSTPGLQVMNTYGLQGYIDGDADSYTQDLTGFFIPPVSANYSFYLRADEWLGVYISTDEKAANARTIAFTSYAPYWHYRATQKLVSDPVWLEAGRRYWTRIRHVDGSSNDWFDVAIRIHTENNPAAANVTSENQRAFSSTPEIQMLSFSTVVAREVQVIELTGAQNGQWTITWPGQSLPSDGSLPVLNHNAADYQVANVLNGIGGCRSVAVTRSAVTTATNATGYRWTASFNCPIRGAYPTVTASSISMQPQAGQTVSLDARRVTSASAPATGSFALQYGNDTTTQLSPQASAAQIKAALEALPSVHEVDVGGGYGNMWDSGYWLITFWSPYGDQPMLVPVVETDSGPTLAGTNVTMTASELHAGSNDPFYWPAPMDFFEAALPMPAVTVRSNGFLASCDVFNFDGSTNMDCSYQYDASITPTITGVSPTAVTAGDVLTITGTNFLTEADGIGKGPGGSDVPIWKLNVVYLNDSVCNVTSATATELQCRLSDASFGSYLVDVEVALGRNFAVRDQSVPPVSYPMVLDSVSPLTGSKMGGTLITLSGTGFRRDAGRNSVTVGGGVCTPVSATFTTLTCLTPAAPAGTTAQISAVIVANGVGFSSSFVYDSTLTPQLSALAPLALSSAITGVVNFTLTGVPAGAFLTVSFGARPCNIRGGGVKYGTSTTVSCTLVRGPALPLPQAPVAPLVSVGTLGYANASSFALDTGFRVERMSAQNGSLEGGAELTFYGVGFSAQAYQNEVVFYHVDNWGYEWRTPCNVVSFAADGTNMTCITPKIPDWKRGQPKLLSPRTPLRATMWLKVNNITAPCAGALDGCSYTQSIEYTPVFNATWLSADRKTLFVTGDSIPVPGIHVTINGWNCMPPTPINATTFSCPLPIGIAGTYPIHAHVHRWGMARSNATHSFEFIVDTGLSATIGSTAGGTRVTFTGEGFADDDLSRNVVVFGDLEAVVLSATRTSLTVLTPPSVSSATTAVNVTLYVKSADYTNVNAQTALPYAFTYEPSLAFSPTLTSVRPTSGFAGQLLVLRGTGFGNASAQHAVSIGGADCAIDVAQSNDTTIMCALGSTPAGLHRIFVSVPGKGYARTLPSASSVRFQSLLEVTGASQTSSSFGGRAVITYSGRGFSTAALGSTRIDMCQTTCEITSVNYTHATCQSKPIITRAALSQFKLWTPGMIMGTITPSSAAAAHDMSVGASFTACQMNMDLGVNERAVITGVRFYPKFRSVSLLRNARFLASNDSVNWDLIYRVPYQVNEGWNNVDLYNAPGVPTVDYGTLPSYRYLRFVFAGSGSACMANEIEFRGFAVAARDDAVCNVTVTVDAADSPRIFTSTVAAVSAAAAPSAALAYDIAATPFVSRIEPNNGTALGGTTVVLSGRNFPSSASDVEVWLNGVKQFVVSSTPSTITIITSRRPEIFEPSVNVTIAGIGAALYDASTTYFKYTDRWSELTTWKYQEPPIAGDTVVVPAGQSVLVDMSPPELFLVLVQGELIFDRQDLTFDATYIFVHGGRLEIGTEAEPFLNKLTITLHGDRYKTVEIPEVGAKCLAVMDRGGTDSHSGGHDHHDSSSGSTFSRGFLEVHGKPRKRVWTKLGAASPAGTDVIVTREDVDWQVGETLIITSTRNVWHTERVVVKEVIDARTLRVAVPFEHDHEYQIYPAGEYGFVDADMSAEVGLLSRNVVIRGDDNSYSQSFGVHTGAFHGGVFHMENAEIHDCGQSGQLGRYCTHAHMLSDDFVSYVRYNSIHDSYQRITTIHATNHMLVKHNVGFKVRGHSIFVEDGVERYNVIEENLIGWTLPCALCIDSDTKPANFWAASPTNFWRHNVAFGSTHFGYWIEPPGAPHGPSYTPDYCPVNMPLGEFFNNTAHSSTIGLRIYPSYAPMAAGCDTSQGTAPQYFYNSTFFHNGQGIFHRNVGDVHHRNHKMIENSDHGFFWKKYVSPGLKFSWDANIGDSLFVCTTDPKGASSCGIRALTAPQQEFFYSSGLTVVNYGDVGALAGCNSCDSDNDFSQGGFTYRWDRLRFVNTTRRTHWNSPYKCIFWDLDGTLTGYPNGTALPYWAFNNWPECPRDAVGTFEWGTVCNGSTRARRIQIENVNPRELDFVNLNITSDVGSQQLQFRPRETYGWVYPAVNGHTYLNQFKSLVDWRTLRIRYTEPDYIVPGEWTGLTWSWIDYRYRNRVIYDGREVPALPVGMPTGQHDFGTGNMPDGNKTWTVMLTTNNITNNNRFWRYTMDVANIQCPPNGCYVPPPINLGNATLWSDTASWPNGRLPAAGEDVVINATQYIIMDVNPPKLRRLTINGRLEFKDSARRSLHADAIVVWGELVIGTPASPFLNDAEIVLYGTRTSDAVVLDNNLFLGNKMMAVLGKVTMHGRPRSVTWTRLARTANPGDTTLQLTQSVQGVWVAGDRLALTPTDYNIAYLEDVAISSVSGSTVTLSAPLKYRHFAGIASPGGPAPSVTLRSAVGLLTRNVVFRANLTSDADTYGAHMSVAVVERPGASPTQKIRREGSVDLRYVELRHTGKQGMEHGSVNFQYGNFLFSPAVPATNAYNYLEGIALAYGFNYGIVAIASKHIAVRKAVFHRNFRNSLDFDADSVNATVTDNLFAGNFRSPDVNEDGQLPWIRPQSAVFFGCVPGRMTGNVVGGAVDAGFTVRGPDCNDDASRWSSNEAHAARIGLFILSTYSRSSCVRFDGFTAWKSAHIGILTVDQVSNVELRNAVVADNHIGISLNYLRSSPSESFSRIRNSTVMGSTMASQTSSCSESSQCMAVTKQDVRGERCGSVLGTAYRRAGILLPQYLNRGKTCERDFLPVCRPPNMIERLCSLPWERRYGTIGTSNTALYLDGVVFTDFNITDCGARSTAIVHNPTQIDLSVPVYMSRIQWHNTTRDSRFDFSVNEQTPPECADGKGCDAVNNYNLIDMDGTATGASGSTVTGPNPLNVLESPTCASRERWSGFECPRLKLSKAVIQNVKSTNQAFGGLQITRRVNPLDNSTWRTSMSFGSTMEECSLMPAQPIYAHIIQPGLTHELFWPSTEPDRIRYNYFAKDASESAVIELFIARPWSWDVSVDGVAVPMKEGSNATHLVLPSLSDPAGTWVFSPQRRRLWFTIRGGQPDRAINFVRSAAVQLTVNLAVSVEQFFGPELVNNLALLLSIPAYRIKIVDVQPGSTSVAVEIQDEAPAVVVEDPVAVDNHTIAQVQQQVQRLQTIAAQIQTLAETGQMTQIGAYTVTSMALVPPSDPILSTGPGDSGSDSPAPITIVPAAKKTGLTDGQLAGAVVGAVLGVAVIAGALVMYRRVQSSDRSKLTRASTVDKRVDPGVMSGGTNPVWTHGKPIASAGEARASNMVRVPSGRLAWTPVTVAPAGSSRAVAAPQSIGGSPNSVRDVTNMPL